MGEECVININTAEAGYGNITCRIHSTSDTDVDIDIVDNGDGTVSLMYTPRVPGAYTLNIKFGGQPVPNGQFTQQVGYEKTSYYPLSRFEFFLISGTVQTECWSLIG